MILLMSKIRIIQLPSLFIQIVQSQETLGQLVEAVGFMHHDFQVFLLSFERWYRLNSFCIALDGGQGGAESWETLAMNLR